MLQQPCRLALRRYQALMRRLCSAFWSWLILLVLIGSMLLINQPAHAAPMLWLPFPAGESWRIIQGYACGTHNSYDRYALDLVRANGPIYGAPVRAAADGTVFGWFASSGTLILRHTSTFYTQYTHMATVTAASPGQFVPQGAIVGTVGDRGSPGIPHLHFMAFTASGPYASGRQTVPLRFADGYDLPEIGGCNQHGGKILTAKAREDLPPPAIRFSSSLEPEHWYNADARIDFEIDGAVLGFSQRWNEDPTGEEPMFPMADAGYAQLEWVDTEGMHTFYVRAWGINGDQVVETYGPFGYDVIPPEPPSTITPVVVTPGITVSLRWYAAQDSGSGVKGYRVYIGKDTQGESDWFATEPEVVVPSLAPGTYWLRVQALDKAGNVGEWTTLGQVLSQTEATMMTPTVTATPLPPTATATPSAQVPPTTTMTALPPTATALPPTTTLTETATPLPPTTTALPPTATSPPPSATTTNVPEAILVSEPVELIELEPMPLSETTPDPTVTPVSSTASPLGAMGHR